VDRSLNNSTSKRILNLFEITREHKPRPDVLTSYTRMHKSLVDANNSVGLVKVN